MDSASKKTFSLSEFLAGGIIGGAAALLFAPTTGKELRKRIINNANIYIAKAQSRQHEIIARAKATADDLIIRAEQLKSLSEKYATLEYNDLAGRIEEEIQSLKKAIEAAEKSYKTYSVSAEDIEEEIDDIFSEYEDETLPKHLGMKKRV